MPARSPLKAAPLRNPGQSLDEEISLWRDETLSGVLVVATYFVGITAWEWVADLTHQPRRPVLWTLITLAVAAWAAWRVRVIRQRVKRLQLGRNGERVVGQFLEGLRVSGARVFHDVPAEGFNLDHVVISSHGIYAIETKTVSKPAPTAIVKVEGEHIEIAGRVPDRNPIQQARGQARWLEQLLESSTGKRFAVRGVVVFPGWFIEHRGPVGAVWVLEPKALPAFIERSPPSVADADIALVAFHLGRYVRAVEAD